MAIALFRLRKNIRKKSALGSVNCLCTLKAVAAEQGKAAVAAATVAGMAAVADNVNKNEIWVA